MSNDPFARMKAPKRTAATGEDRTTAQNEAQEFFKQQQQQQKDSLQYMFDGNFFTCVVFPSEEHRDRFLDAVEAVSFFGDDPQYVDGMELARVLKIDMPPIKKIPPPKAGHSWRGVPIFRK